MEDGQDLGLGRYCSNVLHCKTAWIGSTNSKPKPKIEEVVGVVVT